MSTQALAHEIAQLRDRITGLEFCFETVKQQYLGLMTELTAAREEFRRYKSDNAQAMQAARMQVPIGGMGYSRRQARIGDPQDVIMERLDAVKRQRLEAQSNHDRMQAELDVSIAEDLCLIAPDAGASLDGDSLQLKQFLEAVKTEKKTPRPQPKRKGRK